MTPERRYELLAVTNAAALEALADEILAAGVTIDVTHGPEVVSAPVRLPTPTIGSTVVVGHVALTTCEVRLGGRRGVGVRPARQLAAAVAAAICDAEATRDGAFAPRVAELCHAAAAEQAAARADAAGVVDRTRTTGPEEEPH